MALSNGHIGLRANLDEGEPHGLPGTYLNGFYEIRPLPYPEGGYGYPESGQSIINVTDGKIIRLLVEDEPFDVRYGTLHAHERVLDLREGVLRRTVDWTSPAGTRGADLLHATGVVHPAGGGRDRVDRRAGRRRDHRGGAVRAGGERAAPGGRRPRPAGGGRAGALAERRVPRPRRHAAPS